MLNIKKNKQVFKKESSENNILKRERTLNECTIFGCGKCNKKQRWRNEKGFQLNSHEIINYYQSIRKGISQRYSRHNIVYFRSRFSTEIRWRRESRINIFKRDWSQFELNSFSSNDTPHRHTQPQ